MNNPVNFVDPFGFSYKECEEAAKSNLDRCLKRCHFIYGALYIGCVTGCTYATGGQLLICLEACAKAVLPLQMACIGVCIIDYEKRLSECSP